MAMNYSEPLIQKALFKKFISHRYKFLNVYFFENESDYLTFLPNGYCYEIEIKISRSDFKADFKKIKHQIHSENQKGNKWFMDKKGLKTNYDPSWEFCKNFPELIIAEEYQDYRQRRYNEWSIRLKFNPYSMIDFRRVSNERLPNKFFYAAPVGLISKDEVPEYAGLLYINEDLSVTKVKDGRFIHKDCIKPDKLFNKTYNAYESMMYQKFRNLK